MPTQRSIWLTENTESSEDAQVTGWAGKAYEWQRPKGRTSFKSRWDSWDRANRTVTL